MYNILSLLLGLAALVFAFHSAQVRGCLICCTVSGTLVGLSVLCQLIDLDRLAGIMDASAIYDTTHARVFAAAVLVTAVTALNLTALLRGRKKDCKTCDRPARPAVE